MSEDTQDQAEPNASEEANEAELDEEQLDEVAGGVASFPSSTKDGDGTASPDVTYTSSGDTTTAMPYPTSDDDDETDSYYTRTPY